MKPKPFICPECGVEIQMELITRAAAEYWGQRGGAAGKGSPARVQAARKAASVRWNRPTTKRPA